MGSDGKPFKKTGDSEEFYVKGIISKKSEKEKAKASREQI